MGRGTGSNWASFALAPVYLFNVCEISWLAQASTDSKQKGLFAVKAQEMKNSLDAAMQGIEGLINSDGSGENLAGLKRGEFGESPAMGNTEPSRT